MGMTHKGNEVEFCKFTLRMRSDALSGDGIQIGDVLVCAPCASIRNGQLVAAVINGEHTIIRRYARRDDRILLQASCFDYQDIELPADSVRILGIITTIQRRMISAR